MPHPGKNRKKIGRNDACPCGSGKKYKRCCLKADEQAAAAALRAAPQGALLRATPENALFAFVDDLDELDELDEISNGVIDLVDDNRWDEAEEACRTLADRWPNEVDGLDRLAYLRAAQGRHAEAADLSRRAAEFARTHDGFDEESVAAFLAEASSQDDLARAGASAPR